MKRFISFILLAIIFITSCGISEGSENDDKKAVASAFSDYINAAKNEDTKKVGEYHLMWINIWRTSQESYKYLTYKINKIELTKQKNGKVQYNQDTGISMTFSKDVASAPENMEE